jgi:hypothetical protein
MRGTLVGQIACHRLHPSIAVVQLSVVLFLKHSKPLSEIGYSGTIPDTRPSIQRSGCIDRVGRLRLHQLYLLPLLPLQLLIQLCHCSFVLRDHIGPFTLKCNAPAKVLSG